MGAAGGELLLRQRAPPPRGTPSTRFQIAHLPVSNESWMHFSEGGGYVRREWWSDEGWAWKEQFDITHHAGVADARPAGARLPRVLVRGRRLRPRARCAPSDRGGVGEGGDLDPGTAAGDVSARRGVGVDLVLVRGLPGLPRTPLPRVLGGVLRHAPTACCAGSSWATHPRVASTTFRNWDLPQRRQIFAGVRLAREA